MASALGKHYGSTLSYEKTGEATLGWDPPLLASIPGCCKPTAQAGHPLSPQAVEDMGQRICQCLVGGARQVHLLPLQTAL